jgi:hypothetical protein
MCRRRNFTDTNTDNTIIATAIPKITSVFDSLNDVGWVSDSFSFKLRILLFYVLLHTHEAVVRAWVQH